MSIVSCLQITLSFSLTLEGFVIVLNTSWKKINGKRATEQSKRYPKEKLRYHRVKVLL